MPCLRARPKCRALHKERRVESTTLGKVRCRSLIVMALAAVILSACGSAPGTGATSRTPPTTIHIALPAGPNPSESAKMVCAREAQRELANVLGVSTVSPVAPAWVDHLYSCRYVYADGMFALSVKEVSNRAQTTAYFDTLGQRLGRTGGLNGLGQGAYTTTNGDVVVRKDYKVLLVDVSGLPPKFGVPATTSAEIAITVADVIMGCWSGS
jgi:hypothetical protein